jgi:hypothetical protein
MEMVRHQQHQSAMPIEMLMVMFSRSDHSLSHAVPTNVILLSGLAADCDKEKAPRMDPLRDVMRKPLALWFLHNSV